MSMPRWRMPQTYSSELRTLCGRGSSGEGCVSAVYSTCGISYNHVYVRVLGYGRRSLDAFDGPHHRRPLWEWSSCPLHANLLEEGNTSGPLQLDSLRLYIPPTLFLPVLVWVEVLLHLQGKWLLLWRWESWPNMGQCVESNSLCLDMQDEQRLISQRPLTSLRHPNLRSLATKEGRHTLQRRQREWVSSESRQPHTVASTLPLVPISQTCNCARLLIVATPVLKQLSEVSQSKVTWQQYMWRNYCTCDKWETQTKRHEKLKATLGLAGRMFLNHMWPTCKKMATCGYM